MHINALYVNNINLYCMVPYNINKKKEKFKYMYIYSHSVVLLKSNNFTYTDSYGKILRYSKQNF